LYNIVFYTTVRGDSPIDDFLDQIVMAHAFSKKTQQLKEKDIKLAERRMEDWTRRFPSGGKT
jgi:hypothetical protein